MILTNLMSQLRKRPRQYIAYYEGAALKRKTFGELADDVARTVSQLESGGVTSGMHVGILSHNSYEWLVYDLAILQLRAVCVALPVDHFAASPLEEVASRYGLHLLLVGKSLLKTQPPWVCTMDLSARDGITLRSVSEEEPQQLGPDLLSLVFSSGTSGRLKCLMMSRRGTEAFIARFGHDFAFRSDDAILAFLPLSTVQQRWMLYTAIHYGFNLHLTTPVRLFHALTDMRPTMIGAAPLLYETVEARYLQLSAKKRIVLDAARRVVRRLPSRLRGPVGRIVFKPFHDAFGGRLRFALAGAAPIRRTTLEFFESIGLPLYTAYGLTETGFLSWNMPNGNRMGSVGKQVYPNTLELAPDGEILFRPSTPLAYGYLDVDPEEAAKTFVAPGLIATGDIGRFDADGYLYIDGRKKDIIVTPGGYKLQPEDLERKIEDHAMVSRAVVLGGGDLPCVTALVSTREQSDDRDVKAIRRQIEEINKQLPPPSRIGKVVFTAEQFSIASGLLNRNLKVDRNKVAARFQSELGR